MPTIFDHIKKKQARKPLKNRSACAATAPKNFSSLLLISSENQQNEWLLKVRKLCPYGILSKIIPST